MYSALFLYELQGGIQEILRSRVLAGAQNRAEGCMMQCIKECVAVITHVVTVYNLLLAGLWLKRQSCQLGLPATSKQQATGSTGESNVNVLEET